ncbi:unnamed protein product [Spirodela intermedia]|uniref:Uncharacterized protein n=2 Tax=Spirodela intermedia TaxID=51605 RepID=A0A7I8L085_SPIIN|nr:unnamed protein product [Spirodela intermedia]CAA6666665.1 unnamed protein product [Spirodela intermedia]CAA7403463.1 unnamed protein product [Spirodela intermedia]
MKKAGAFVASIAAASSMALHPGSASSSNSSDGAGRVLHHSSFGYEVPSSSSSSGKQLAKPANGGAGPEDKFAPRFDGLRFIETLITAHR